MDILPISSGSAGNAYRISDGATALLIEAGLPLPALRKALNFTLSELSGCLVSHVHLDHSKSAKNIAKSGIDVYVGTEAITQLQLAGYRILPLTAMQKFDVGTFTVLPFPLEHDCQCYGFLVKSNHTGEKLVYVSDTVYCKYIFPKVNYIMLEANFDNDILRDNATSGEVDERLRARILQTHMSMQTCKEFILANDMSTVKEIYLLHLSDSNSSAEQFKREIQSVSGKPVIVC